MGSTVIQLKPCQPQMLNRSLAGTTSKSKEEIEIKKFSEGSRFAKIFPE
jgi:hypothetical protein